MTNGRGIRRGLWHHQIHGNKHRRSQATSNHNITGHVPNLDQDVLHQNCAGWIHCGHGDRIAPPPNGGSDLNDLFFMAAALGSAIRHHLIHEAFGHCRSKCDVDRPL